MVGRDGFEKSTQTHVFMDLRFKSVILEPPKIPPFQPLDARDITISRPVAYREPD